MLDDFISQIHALQRKLEQLDGEHTLPISELFNDDFMLRNTEFASIDAMLQSSAFRIETTEDLAAIPTEVWEPFVRDHTRFGSWEEMKSAAAREWALRRLQ